MDDQMIASDRGASNRGAAGDRTPKADIAPPVVQGASPIAIDPDPNHGVILSMGREVSLRVVRDAEDPSCRLWVGLTSHGPHQPLALLAQATTTEVLTTAATSGTREDGPLMLFDTLVSPPRSILLLPVPAPNFRDRSLWMEETLASLSAWAPPKLGLYLAPTAAHTDPGFELLLMTLRHLILDTNTEEVYLMTGVHGLNPLLNAALRLKTELQADAVDLYIYH